MIKRIKREIKAKIIDRRFVGVIFGLTVLQWVVFQKVEASMDAMIAKATSDAGVWQSRAPKAESSESSIKENFSLKDGADADEKARWDKVKGMNLESDGAIETLKKEEQSSNRAYAFIDKSKKTRTHYNGVQHEEPWSNSQRMDEMKDPSRVFAGTFKDCKAEPVYRVNTTRSVHTCQEGIPTTHHTCVRYLNKASRVEKEKVFDHTLISHFEDWFWRHSKDPRKLPEERRTWYTKCRNAWYHNQTHVYSFRKREATISAEGVFTYSPWVDISETEYGTEIPTTLEDEWVSDCEELEKRTKAGLCRKVSSKCTSKETTRELEGGPLTRDCWQEKHVYECSREVDDTCAPLRAKGCIQRKSTCLEHYGPTCVKFEVELECIEQTKEETGEAKLVCGGAPYCMNGQCFREDSTPNNDLIMKEMVEAMAKLKVLSETAKYRGGDERSLEVFRGNRLQCKKDMMSFRDCCNGGGGWGMSMNLAGCGAEEQNLATQRSKGLCIEVGTYCAHREKFTKMCLSKKTSFCCFPNKLLKVIQEQGRQQLGIGWGDPKDPNSCRGLLIDKELSRIDFSRLNLREVEQELMSSLSPSFGASRVDETLRERLSQMQESLRGSSSSGGSRGGTEQREYYSRDIKDTKHLWERAMEKQSGVIETGVIENSGPGAGNA